MTGAEPERTLRSDNLQANTAALLEASDQPHLLLLCRTGSSRLPVQTNTFTYIHQSKYRENGCSRGRLAGAGAAARDGWQATLRVEHEKAVAVGGWPA